MSWTFEFPAECDLFKLVVSRGAAGTSQANLVDVELEPGEEYGRVKTASATISGHLHIEWEDGYELDQYGFQAGDPSLPDQMLRPGKTVNTAVTDIVGICATPHHEHKLNRKWYFVEAGDTIQHTQRGYLVPVVGAVKANGVDIPLHTIARSETFTIEAIEDASFMIIWER